MPTALEMLDPFREFVPLTQRNPAVADVTVPDLILDGRPMDAQLVDPEEVGLERRLDGASNLTVSVKDPALETARGSGLFRPKLLNSGIFSKAVDVDLTVRNLDGVRDVVERLAFRLADPNVTEIAGVIGLDLLFEATAVARLRTFTGAKHASRNDKTRAEFIKALCDEAGVPFVCPDLRKKQRIQTPEEAMTPAQRKAERVRDANVSGRGGTAKGKTSEITVKGKKATAEQLKNMQIASRVADAEKAPALAELAMHCAGIGESEYRAIMNQGGSPYGGVWQGNVRDGTWNLNDTAGMARSFLRGGKGFQGGGAIALARAHPDWEPGRIALVVEGSVSNFGGSIARGTAFYNAHRAEGVKIMQAFGASGSLDPLANSGTAEPDPYAVAYMFKRLGADESADNRAEDSWTCMRRLADEVNWRLWEEAGTIYFMTDDRILKSSVEMTIEPMTDGVISLRGRLSNRRERQEITVECDARVWQAGIGTVAEVYGYGKLDGRWIVSMIRRPSLWRPRTTITLQFREAALLEPAHELRTRAPSAEEMIKGTSRDLQGAAGAALGVDLPSPLSARGRIIEIAKASMTTKTGHNYYLAGGSQVTAQLGNPLAKAPYRSDCSQWIHACYVKAGFPSPGLTTYEMASKGTRTNQPLPGDIMLTDGHCELYIGALGPQGKNTIGHGSPPIDYAHTSDFDGHWFVTYRFLNQGGRSEADIASSSPGRRP